MQEHETSLVAAWDQAVEALEFDPMRPIRYAKSFRYLSDASSNGSLLEAGCGQGTGLALAQYLGFKKLVGIEVSSERLKRARSNLDTAVMLKKVGTDSKWDFANDSFDCCVSCAVIEHTEDPEAFVREIARVVKPGARIVISSDCWQWRLLQILGIYKSVQPIDRAMLPGELMRIFKRCGLSLKHYDGFPLPGQEYRFIRMLWGAVKDCRALVLSRRIIGRIKRLLLRNGGAAAGSPSRPEDDLCMVEKIIDAGWTKTNPIGRYLRSIFSDENVFFLIKEGNDSACECGSHSK